MIVKICNYCKEEFETNSRKVKYCSDKCRYNFRSENAKLHLTGRKRDLEVVKKIANSNKGKKRTLKQKENISKAHEGQIPWNKDKVGIYSKETLYNMGKRNRNKHLSKETKKLISKNNSKGFLGKKHNKETLDKISKKLIGRKMPKSFLDNIINTKRKNNSFNTSKPEEEIYKILVKKFNKVERQYRSNLYPFLCDFYIPELGLYIEYQGFWYHGNKPYSEKDRDCIELVNKWRNKNTKFYNKAIEVYTIKDPLKRKIAKENSLNWIEFFNMEEFYIWYNKGNL